MPSKTDKKTPASFYELEIHGPEDVVHGYLSGLAAGAGHRDAVVVHGPDEDIDPPSFREKVKTMLHVMPHECHVIVDNVLRALVKKNAKRMYAETGLNLVEERKVRRARFEFRYQAFAPCYGREIEALLKGLPKGLRLANVEKDEIHDPGAKGTEGYTPAHHYEVKGSGEIAGRFDLVIEARHRLDTHPLVEVEGLELVLV